MSLRSLAAVAIPLLVSTAAAQPAARHHHALTWDPVRRQVVMFAGYSVDSLGNGPILDDLWSWDGSRWTAIARQTGWRVVGHVFFADTAGALFARGGSRGTTAKWSEGRWVPVHEDTLLRLGGAAGAYDSRRGRFVQFGGSVGPGRVNDALWEFDGSSWKQLRFTNGPPPMMMASMVFDARRNVMVLFGGWDPTTQRVHGATWEWDGARWSEIHGAGPPARNGAGMVWDAQRGEVVMFGGTAPGDQLFGDTWIYNGRTWRRAETTGPSARFEPFMAYDVARGVAVLFGGNKARSLGDTWEWDGRAWRQAQPPR